MPTRHDSPIVIGAGHNGLTTAFYLAKSGLKPLVLERRPVVGGAVVTEEIADGYCVPTLAHAIGPLRPSIVRDMQLARRGVTFIHPDPQLVALSPDGRALEFSSDTARTADTIRAFSPKDAERYPEFCLDDGAPWRVSVGADGKHAAVVERAGEPESSGTC